MLSYGSVVNGGGTKTLGVVRQLLIRHVKDFIAMHIKL
jgi:hypothetical protein